MIGTTLGHFRIVAKLAESASGAVYRAEDEALRRHVALKVLSPALASDPEHKARFLKAARAASLVTHPHVAAVHEVSESEGRVWVAMELVEGPSLRSRLAGRPLPLLETLRIGEQVAEGLAAAHAQNLAHGSLGPEKVVLGPGDQVKVVDLGLGDDESVEEGSRTYDTRTDVYRLGAMLYEMATGRPPEAEGAAATNEAQAQEAEPAAGAATASLPPSTLNPDVPAELDRIIGACLEPDPEDRYQTAGQVAVDLGKLRRRTETAEVVTAGEEAAARMARRGMRRRLAQWWGTRSPRWRAASLALAMVLGLAGWRWVWPMLKPGPLFKQGDRIIVADFVNETGNPEYDIAIREIFEANSSGQSDALTTVVQDPKRTEALTPKTLEERCAKGECEGYVTGRIARDGSGYVLEAALHRAGVRPPVVRSQERATDDKNLARGVELLVEQLHAEIRRHMGVAAPVTKGEPCPQPYPSVQGYLAWIKAERYQFQNAAEMITMLERAVALDPDFVFARGRLGLAYSNMRNIPEARRHLGETARVYAALAEKHPGNSQCRGAQLYFEILYLEARYDTAAKLERLNRYVQLFPEDGDMQNILAITLGSDYQDYAVAEPHARKCYELAPIPGHFTNLVRNLRYQGKAAEIEALIAEYRARDAWGDPEIKERAIAGAEVWLAEARGDDASRIVDQIDRLVAAGRLKKDQALGDRGRYLVMAGRLREAEETFRESVRGEEQDYMKTGQSLWLPNWDLMWLEWRRTGRAPALAPEHIRYLEGDLGAIDWGDFAVPAVEMTLAQPLEKFLRHHEEAEKDNLNGTVREKLQFGRGCLAVVVGRAREAVALLEPLVRDSDIQMRHHVLGRAYEAVGRWSDAARSYEIVLKDRRLFRIWPVAVRILDQHRLAGIYERLGNTERARFWYGRFLNDWRDADPGTPEVEDAKRRLAALGGPLPAGS